MDQVRFAQTGTERKEKQRTLLCMCVNVCQCGRERKTEGAVSNTDLHSDVFCIPTFKHHEDSQEGFSRRDTCQSLQLILGAETALDSRSAGTPRCSDLRSQPKPRQLHMNTYLVTERT